MSLQEISRRRAERAEQSGRLSTHLTSYSDAQAQSNFLNVIESYKRGEMYEWPSDFVSLFFNAVCFIIIIIIIDLLVLQLIKPLNSIFHQILKQFSKSFFFLAC